MRKERNNRLRVTLKPINPLCHLQERAGDDLIALANQLVRLGRQMQFTSCH